MESHLILETTHAESNAKSSEPTVYFRKVRGAFSCRLTGKSDSLSELYGFSVCIHT